ncbi:MAG TPA: hypothetical protein VJQ84_09580 [Solirubrobacterales bacterium]|nr:hypothetical protein [Solirubrobacterales bacterium]
MDRLGRALGGSDDFFLLRVAGGSAAALLAALSGIVNGIDGTFLLLAGAAVILLAFPWHRLSALRAGPFEFSLEQGQIKGAIQSIDVGGTERERIEALLSRLAIDVERARGSRILWVDDKPTRVVGERRLFRALEVSSEIVPDCATAAAVLGRDNDFDLVVTSLEKQGEGRALQDGTRNPGVAFVEWLRGKDDAGIERLVGEEAEVPVKDAVVRGLPVVFYAAFPSLSYIQEKLQPLAALEPSAEAARTVDDLLKKTIRALADARSNPIEVSANKKVLAS